MDQYDSENLEVIKKYVVEIGDQLDRFERPTLRDQFAMAAPIERIDDPYIDEDKLERRAELAYEWADAMLKAREGKA